MFFNRESSNTSSAALAASIDALSAVAKVVIQRLKDENKALKEELESLKAQDANVCTKQPTVDEGLSPINNKTFHNSDGSPARKNVHDLQVWGMGDTFKLISKASSESEGWMKSTKAMEVPRLGCVVQVTTQQGDNVAEALAWVPGVTIKEYKSEDNVMIARKLVAIDELQRQSV